ncbi:MAG: PD40 domain-containing protein [Chloroflexi bacterium]|nr:PD40 domain-containing protein [Chloroflexota bacterium]
MMLKNTKLWKRLALSCAISLLLTGCNFAIQSSTPTPTATVTALPTATSTATAAPTLTPTVTSTPAPTLTPTITHTPTLIPPPTIAPTPSATPYPVIGFTNDQWTSLAVPDVLQTDLDRSYFAIASANERIGGTSNPETPVPTNEVETLYLVDPSSGELIELLDLPVNADDRIYWSPLGDHLVYFLDPILLPDNTLAGGLYLVNLRLGVSLRLFDMESLSPRGIPDHRPVWSPDGSQFVVALPTAYDVDIFVISADGTVFRNLTGHGAYDLWPSWSPDGRRLAFVSDRDTCATWMPGEPGSCSTLDTDPPRSGQLYVMDVTTGQTQRVSEIPVDSPPVWVSNLQVAFTSGLSDPFATETAVWLTNVQGGTARQVSDSGALNLGAAWAPGGVQVLYHQVSDPASLVLKDSAGTRINSTDQYLFLRYGFAASWSPGGDRVAFAGRNGQCPYGLVVAVNTLEIVSTATTPRACDPIYSPDGRWLAFAGIQTLTGAADGRLDLYIADQNGYSAHNLTSRLKGDIRLIGWVGPAS